MTPGPQQTPGRRVSAHPGPATYLASWKEPSGDDPATPAPLDSSQPGTAWQVTEMLGDLPGRGARPLVMR